jgi:DNA-binding transcriptional LysR family regulator
MELSQLRAFVAVSRERTIAKAAESLQLTASPVSRTIKELERQVGADLFVRSYHDVVLTPLGEELLPRAVDIVAQADAFLAAATKSPRGIRIGVTPWAPARFGDRLLATARAAGLHLDLESDLSSVLLHDMQHGTVDVAIVHLPVELPGISSRPLGTYQFSILTEPGHELSTLRSVTLSDLAGYHLLTLPLIMQPTAMQGMRDALTAAGVLSVTEVDLKDVINMRARMRRNGDILLGSLADDTPIARIVPTADVAVIPLAPDELNFEIGIAWRTHDTVHAAAVNKLVAEIEPVPGQPLEIVR